LEKRPLRKRTRSQAERDRRKMACPRKKTRLGSEFRRTNRKSNKAAKLAASWASSLVGRTVVPEARRPAQGALPGVRTSGPIVLYTQQPTRSLIKGRLPSCRMRNDKIRGRKKWISEWRTRWNSRESGGGSRRGNSLDYLEGEGAALRAGR